MTLEEFFKYYKKVALAFSGGVDSSYLLYILKKLNIESTAYFIKSEFQPDFELKESITLATKLGADLKIIDNPILDEEKIINNDVSRCYYCKQNIFSHIIKAAKQDGYNIIIDGTNATDDEGDRPGMKALKEMKILSPLKICSLTKEDIRSLSKEAGLPTWDKPSYSCLATRISKGEKIKKNTLVKIEKSESYLFKLGFKDFRIRVKNNSAVIQVKEKDFQKVMENRDRILKTISHMFDEISLDLRPRR